MAKQMWGEVWTGGGRRLVEVREWREVWGGGSWGGRVAFYLSCRSSLFVMDATIIAGSSEKYAKISARVKKVMQYLGDSVSQPPTPNTPNPKL